MRTFYSKRIAQLFAYPIDACSRGPGQCGGKPHKWPQLTEEGESGEARDRYTPQPELLH